jgi:hypothetical protein
MKRFKVCRCRRRRRRRRPSVPIEFPRKYISYIISQSSHVSTLVIVTAFFNYGSNLLSRFYLH